MQVNSNAPFRLSTLALFFLLTTIFFNESNKYFQIHRIFNGCHHHSLNAIASVNLKNKHKKDKFGIGVEESLVGIHSS
jgi:hypothetical protein